MNLNTEISNEAHKNFEFNKKRSGESLAQLIAETLKEHPNLDKEIAIKLRGEGIPDDSYDDEEKNRYKDQKINQKKQQEIIDNFSPKNREAYEKRKNKYKANS